MIARPSRALAKPLDRFEKPRHVDGLFDTTDGRDTPRDLLDTAARRQHQNRDRSQRRIALLFQSEGWSIHPRHHDVQEDETRCRSRAQFRQRNQAIGSARHGVTLFSEKIAKGVADGGIVVDEQDALTTDPHAHRWPKVVAGTGTSRVPPRESSWGAGQRGRASSGGSRLLRGASHPVQSGDHLICRGRCRADTGPPMRARSGTLVMIIDDDADVRRSVQEALVIEGYDVLTLASGERALARLASGIRPSVVIMDLWLPGIGSSAFAHRLRAIVPRIPLLLLTGWPFPERLGLDADAVLRKPAEAVTIARAVDKLALRPVRRRRPRRSPAPTPRKVQRPTGT